MKYSIALRICGETLNPENITRNLMIEPDTQHKKEMYLQCVVKGEKRQVMFIIKMECGEGILKQKKMISEIH